ncbi:interleukin-12 subunit alpha [Oryzias melastigma]|uniref:Interleukin-12 subunit alpha n=1 Tax=Oryzias melastigma TaxID=30732 RepID=A0A3B3CEA6_ORYME|nr:interleukin-12 subunit alpha [Oryzias melastigma]
MTEQSQTESESTTTDKMHLFKLCFAPVALLLLLMLSSSVWHVSESLPVKSKKPVSESCVVYARMLLENVTQALTQTKLFTGINCTEQNMELNLNTNTPHVCAPKEATCLGNTKLDFNQESCLSNISRDLSHYYILFMAQPDLIHVPTFIHSLRELMENCFVETLPSDLTLNEDPVSRASTYNERLSLCKTLRGFQVRAITISRAISYMSSGEHTK